MSESSSCGSDTSERITDRLGSHRQVRIVPPSSLPPSLSLSARRTVVTVSCVLSMSS